MANPIGSSLPVYVYDDPTTNDLVFAAAHDGKLWPLAVHKAGQVGLDDAPQQEQEQTPDGEQPTEV